MLTVIVREKNKIVFNGQAKTISSYNEKGAFDILPMHTNFVSVIHKELELRKLNNERLQISLEQKGIIKVKENAVEIYLGL